MGMQQIHVLWLTHKVPFQYTHTAILTMRMPIAPKGVGLFHPASVRKWRLKMRLLKSW